MLASTFPPVRAIIFDMDGLLINTEDMITLAVNSILDKYNRPRLTKTIRAKLMGIPRSTDSDIFHDWAQLPISRDQFATESSASMKEYFLKCAPLPGAEALLINLRTSYNLDGEKIKLALASTTTSMTFGLKTSGDVTKRLLDNIEPETRVLGDDPRLPPGRSKPAPDLYQIALQTLNTSSFSDLKEKALIQPAECLVFEDSVVGVEAARRAGMRVIWVPHPDVAAIYESEKEQVLAGRSGTGNMRQEWQLGQIGDGFAEEISSLIVFDYAKYGIRID